MSKNHESDVAFIKALAELLRENDLSELEVSRAYGEDDSLDVRVARQMVAAPAPSAPIQVSAPQPVQPAAPTPAAPSAPTDDPAQDPGAVTSPMVGTVYLSPEPGAAPFVQVGDTVSEGQTILIVEAMKTMNQIPAPRGGKVTRILVEDGAPVEYGAPLVILS
ncbi:Biotin carboxyl carrier protein of acetyl-CoA carboxylase [Jannaschia seosinensis]|uniref:Biotin carboxyl carrier protein of acetyl-CoA carboxylase n=1 Tax=Jannaschia seosinensis TaxID=313367 RepID=A0A0M7B8P1_9RHOB|nr:acetyl-CoA carboxylase biotin carboxyl carrier protein [Jannaschia seosinensis]CUH37329.1 Biotin carboxyl carrier protein of acetyl-CoA carboxylase [Jannaschia seosinensis]